MAGNGGVTSSGVGGASISVAAATAAGSADTRFPPQEWGSRWGGCWGGFSCFGSSKRGKRIVPSSRIPDGVVSTNRANGFQAVGMSNQTITLTPSLLAPPSSPTSFTNSAVPSTVQSPSCFLSMSANSPGEPSSTMFATGPYAHETQLVSPPVFSTFTTEPSTAPFTPPPELAHLTTPSSPDVPFAKFLSSSLDLKSAGKENAVPFISTGYLAGSDLQATYPLCPGSPTSSLISPVSGTPRTGVSSPFPDQEIPFKWDTSIGVHETPYSRNKSSKLFGLDTATSRNFLLSSHSSFFCPASSAQFHLDQAQQSSSTHPHNGGRLSISREVDIHSGDGNRHNKTCKQDVEEMEAYRASFGFSADEIITTPSYVEISDVTDDSFTMAPFLSNNRPCIENCPNTEMINGEGKLQKTHSASASNVPFNGVDGKVQDTSNACAGPKTCTQSGEISLSNGNSHFTADDESFSKLWKSKVSKSFCSGQSISDAEIDYRRTRSFKDDINISASHG